MIAVYLLAPPPVSDWTLDVWDVSRGGEQCEDDELETATWIWQGGNGKVETGEQGEAAKLEDARGLEWRARLPHCLI